MRESDERGVTYTEVLVAMVIIVVAVIPAIEALQTAMLGAAVRESFSAEHYAATARMEEVLAEQHLALVAAAAAAGDHLTPSAYSDAAGTPVRRLVFLGLYDADNADGDSNPFTVFDPDLDGDSDPFSNYTGLIWVQVRIDGSVTGFESLASQ